MLMLVPQEDLPTLAPVKRRDGARSTIVMLAFGYARRRQKAKTLPAIPEPEMRTLGDAMFHRDWTRTLGMTTILRTNILPLIDMNYIILRQSVGYLIQTVHGLQWWP